VAELGPGDALFIPPLWWHHVESLEPFNVLVNYCGTISKARARGRLGLRRSAAWHLEHPGTAPESRRRVERVFRNSSLGDANQSVEHIPLHRHGILDGLSEEQRSALRAHLAKKLTR